MALASAATITKDYDAPVIKYDSDVNFDGTYHTIFETGNGIVMEEHGVLKNAGNKETEAEEVVGSVSYTAPDGTPINLKYIANENGYFAEGAHLPVAPAVPAQIARALEWIATHPQTEKPSVVRKY